MTRIKETDLSIIMNNRWKLNLNKKMKKRERNTLFSNKNSAGETTADQFLHLIFFSIHDFTKIFRSGKNDGFRIPFFFLFQFEDRSL